MGLGDKLIRQNYSYKDFINDIGVILGGASMYLKRPERIELREIAYVSLQRVEDFYAKIPFHALQDIEEWREVFNNMSKIKKLCLHSGNHLMQYLKKEVEKHTKI